jgi:hypothetical protein
MSNSYFIPSEDNQFLVWLKTLLAYVRTKSEAWNIPQAQVNKLKTLSTNINKKHRLINLITKTMKTKNLFIVRTGDCGSTLRFARNDKTFLKALFLVYSYTRHSSLVTCHSSLQALFLPAFTFGTERTGHRQVRIAGQLMP